MTLSADHVIHLNDERVYNVSHFMAAQMKRSVVHGHFTDDQIASLVLPPAYCNQYAILETAIITWAWLSDEAQARFVDGNKIDDADWQSGHHAWLIDLVCLDQHPRRIMSLLRDWFKTNTSAKVVRYIRGYPDGRRVIKEFHLA